MHDNPCKHRRQNFSFEMKGVVCFQQDNPRSLIAYVTKELLQKSQLMISFGRPGLWTF
jgi:hypothetical protein